MENCCSTGYTQCLARTVMVRTFRQNLTANFKGSLVTFSVHDNQPHRLELVLVSSQTKDVLHKHGCLLELVM